GAPRAVCWFEFQCSTLAYCQCKSRERTRFFMEHEFEALRQQRLKHHPGRVCRGGRRNLREDVKSVQFQPTWTAEYLIAIDAIGCTNQFHHRCSLNLVDPGTNHTAAHQ